MKADDETSSAAEDHRDRDGEHLSTPSPDTSEFNSENELEGSSVAEEENDAPVDDDDDDDDDDDNDDYSDDKDDDIDQPNTSRGDSAADRMLQVHIGHYVETQQVVSVQVPF